MPRLMIHVEGETEETFVNEVLAPHLYTKGWESVSPRLVGNARLRSHRGGIKSWASVQEEITRHLRQDSGCYATTLVDYYALPHSWPGRREAVGLPMNERASHVESLLEADVVDAMGTSFRTERFMAFVVMHEFEALLFSDCQAFSESVGRPDLAPALQAIRDTFETPEDINDSPLTAPSKRVIELFGRYQKTLFGPIAALGIGLERMRAECPHFADWMDRLEEIVT